MARLDLPDKYRDEDSVDSSVTSDALGTDVRSLTETYNDEEYTRRVFESHVGTTAGAV